MTDLLSLSKVELETFLIEKGLKKFRAAQIFHYVYQEAITNWDDMVLLPKKDREFLKKNVTLFVPSIQSMLESADGMTTKLLLELADGNTIETVLMRHDYGNSICVSSQVGCAVNCTFCASAKNGFVRNLTVGEMTSQLLAFKQSVTPELHSIVIMGTGEPLLNYDNVLAFMRHIHDQNTLYMGYRNMALSTAGIVPKIYELAEEGMPITLAVSLHAPTDALRRKIMPIANQYALPDIIKAADHYFQTTGRKVTYEYILLKDINCNLSCAKELVTLLHGKNILLNLIPMNDTYDVGLYRPEKKEVKLFLSYLQDHGLNVTLRKEMGSKIRAACGQLRIQKEREKQQID